VADGTSPVLSTQAATWARESTPIAEDVLHVKGSGAAESVPNATIEAVRRLRPLDDFAGTSRNRPGRALPARRCPRVSRDRLSRYFLFLAVSRLIPTSGRSWCRGRQSSALDALAAMRYPPSALEARGSLQPQTAVRGHSCLTRVQFLAAFADPLPSVFAGKGSDSCLSSGALRQ
jgi:hypothetical protein